MKHTISAIALSTALLAACGPGDPDPMPVPSSDPEAGVEAAGDEALTDEADSTVAMSETDDGSQDPDMSNYASGSTIDVESAMSNEAADGVWVTKPNWTGFGPENSEASFMVACAEYEMIRLTRAVEIDPAKPVPAIIAAGERTERGYWKADEGAQIPAATLEIYAASPVFDEMSGAERIGVLAEGQPPLIVPGDPQLDQQIEACRQSGAEAPLEPPQ